MSPFPEAWYVVQMQDATCAIMTLQDLSRHQPSADDDEEDESPTIECWGPFKTEAEALERRASMIRAGKCKPNL
jgi:hypothetical protein